MSVTSSKQKKLTRSLRGKLRYKLCNKSNNIWLASPYGAVSSLLAPAQVGSHINTSLYRNQQRMHHPGGTLVGYNQWISRRP